jgi:hypothetical protein
MGRTTVVATGQGHRVTGHSGNGSAVWANIKTGISLQHIDAAIMKAMLQHEDFTTPIENEKRTGSSCAEPHAVSQLLAAGVSFKEIKLEIPFDEGGKKVECHFCGRWIHPDGTIDEAAIQGYVRSPGDLPRWCYS